MPWREIRFAVLRPPSKGMLPRQPCTGFAQSHIAGAGQIFRAGTVLMSLLSRRRGCSRCEGGLCLTFQALTLAQDSCGPGSPSRPVQTWVRQVPGVLLNSTVKTEHSSLDSIASSTDTAGEQSSPSVLGRALLTDAATFCLMLAPQLQRLPPLPQSRRSRCRCRRCRRCSCGPGWWPGRALLTTWARLKQTHCR
jgi:hypothetical protein